MVVGDEAHVTNLLVAPELTEAADRAAVSCRPDRWPRSSAVPVTSPSRCAPGIMRRDRCTTVFGLAPVGMSKGYYGDDDALILWVQRDRQRCTTEPDSRSAMTPLVLAFETSCDETAVAVVRGAEPLSNVVSHPRSSSTPVLAGWSPSWQPGPMSRRSAPSPTGPSRRPASTLPTSTGSPRPPAPGLVGSSPGRPLVCQGHGLGPQLPFVGIDHMEGHLMAPRLEFEGLRASGGRAPGLGRSFPDRPRQDWGDYETLGSDHRRRGR